MNGFGYKANTNLYQLKFTFSSDGSDIQSKNFTGSKTFNSLTGASLDPKIHSIPVMKMIGAVEVNIRDSESNIYGIRFIDSNGNKVQERQWRRSTSASWVRIEVPQGMEIVGFHGSHDGNYIKQLGLILWSPNPKAT